MLKHMIEAYEHAVTFRKGAEATYYQKRGSESEATANAAYTHRLNTEAQRWEELRLELEKRGLLEKWNNGFAIV